MRKDRNAFTLVELLVVIAVISVLAAMLLPSVEQSLALARSISCLNDRKQNYLAISAFAMEHNDHLPNDIRNWASGNRRCDNFLIGYHPSVRETLGTIIAGTHDTAAVIGGAAATGAASPLAILAPLGYVREPQLYFCPDFLRTDAVAAGSIDRNAAAWAQMCDYSTPMPGGTLGISHYFYIGGGPYESVALSGPNLSTLTSFARYYNTSRASPMIVSCANRRSGAYTYPYMRSHALEGLNGVFFDGSARWIGVAEIDPTGARQAASGIDHMSNCSALFGSLQPWARSTLTMTGK